MILIWHITLCKEHIQQYVSWQRFLAKSSGTTCLFYDGWVNPRECLLRMWVFKVCFFFYGVLAFLNGNGRILTPSIVVYRLYWDDFVFSDVVSISLLINNSLLYITLSHLKYIKVIKITKLKSHLSIFRWLLGSGTSTTYNLALSCDYVHIY